MKEADGEADPWEAVRRRLSIDEPLMREALIGEAQQRQALLTLILAGSPRRDDHLRVMQEAFGFTPAPLALSIFVLAVNQVDANPLLRPMLTKNLVRLGVNHPEYVTTSAGESTHDAELGLDDALPDATQLSVRAAVDHLHYALAIGTPAGDDPGFAAQRIGNAFDAMVDPPDSSRPTAWDRSAELTPPKDDDEPGRDPAADPGSDDEPSDLDLDLDVVVDHPVVDVPTPPPPPQPGEEPVMRSGEAPPTIHAAAVADGSYAAAYYVAVASALGVDTDQVTPPACSDQASSGTGPHRVFAKWTSKAPLADLARWTNPLYWPTCSKGIFFKGMDTIPAGAAKPSGEDWTADLLERVVIFGEPMATALAFEHATVKQGGTPTMVYSTYDLADPTSAHNELSHDRGRLEVRKRVYSDGVRTEATCTKRFRFVDPCLDGYAELACDTWWGELSIVMSTNCGEGYGPQT